MTALPPEAIDSHSLLQEILSSERLPVWLALDSPERQEREYPFTFPVDKKRVSPSETEIGLVRPSDPTEAYDREIKAKAQHIRDTDAAYTRRIAVLKEQAERDGYSLNQASKEAFFEFLKTNPLIRRGRLVLMENGNLRAVWKGEKETHIGLQFINARSIQYVIFTRRAPRYPVSRVSGRDTLEGLKRQIEAFDLKSVLSI